MSKLFRFLFLFIFMYSLLFPAFGQGHFVVGTIVELNGETKLGLIDYRGWVNNPKLISFKSDEASNKILLGPDDILGFRLENGSRYLSKEFVLETSKKYLSSSNPHNLSFDPTINLTSNKGFLKVLVEGEKSLYLYKDNGKENLYIVSNDSVELLIYKKYKEEIDGVTTFASNNQFLEQLRSYLAECPSNILRTSSTKYMTSSLVNVFDNYYNCMSIDPEYFINKDKIEMKWNIVAGATMTSIDFQSKFLVHLDNIEYNKSIRPSFGVSSELIFPSRRNKWSLRNELIYSEYMMHGLYNEVKNDAHTRKWDSKLEYSYLKTYHLFGYYLNKNKIYLTGGFSNGFQVKGFDEAQLNEEFYGSTRASVQPIVGLTKQSEQSMVIGIGTKLKKVGLEVRFENGNGMSKNVSLSSTTKRYSTWIYYSLN